MKRKFFLLQHTTTPYRTELFNMIDEESVSSNIEFTFFYYRKMAGDRNWVFDPKTMTHKYEILNSFEYFIKKYPLYFSFKLMKKIFQNPDAELILGISWNDFNIFIIIFLKRLGLVKNKIHMWSESNFMDNKGSISENKKFKLRKFVFDTVDGSVIIPGKIAKITLENYWDVHKPLVYLANTVDLDYSKIEPVLLDDNYINILIVARLDEKIKGIINFLRNVDLDDLNKTRIFIAGEGKDRRLYENYIKDNNLDNIFLIGNMDRNKLLTYYKGCDLFLLPSFSDSNPLSVIEALFAGKPILISDRCGNMLETVLEGENGYCFNPFDKEDIKRKFKMIIERENEFKSMGNHSKQIANETFCLNKIVKKFLEQL